jgi:hypothetical protein
MTRTRKARIDSASEAILAPSIEWQFELCYGPSGRATHVLAGIWEKPEGVLYWTRHRLDEDSLPVALARSHFGPRWPG